MPDQPVLTLLLGDVVKLRRTHPCGGSTWLVDRLGADIGLRCQTCGRHVLLERRVLEGRLAGFVSRGDPAMTAAVSTSPAAFRRPVRMTEAIAAREPGDEGNAARGLQEQRLPAPLAVAGDDPDRRQHGPVRADRHRRRLDQLEHRGQPADPDLPRSGGAVLGGRGRLRRPHRPAADPDRHELPAWGRVRRALSRRRRTSRSSCCSTSSSRRSPSSSPRPSWR